jgi:hypothetical protein
VQVKPIDTRASLSSWQLGISSAHWPSIFLTSMRLRSRGRRSLLLCKHNASRPSYTVVYLKLVALRPGLPSASVPFLASSEPYLVQSFPEAKPARTIRFLRRTNPRFNSSVGASFTATRKDSWTPNFPDAIPSGACKSIQYTIRLPSAKETPSARTAPFDEHTVANLNRPAIRWLSRPVADQLNQRNIQGALTVLK